MSDESVVAAAARPANHFLIDKILPAHEISLVAGPVNSGKTTFALEMLAAWMAGQPLWGYESYPAPCCYVNCGRSLAHTAYAIAQLGLEIPFASLLAPRSQQVRDAANRQFSVESLVMVARRRVPDCRLIVADGFDTLCPGNTSHSNIVSPFLAEATMRCYDYGVTILGLVQAGKGREGAHIAAPAERLLGSVAWSAHTQTKFIVEPESPESPQQPDRTIYVLPKSHAPFTLRYRFANDGHFYERAQDVDRIAEFINAVGVIPEGEPITTSQLIDIASNLGIALRSAERMITEMLSLGIIERLKKGTYRRPYVSVATDPTSGDIQ
jgi:AAA domain